MVSMIAYVFCWFVEEEPWFYCDEWPDDGW